MNASADIGGDRIDWMPADIEAIPLSGEFSRWVSRLLGYAVLAGTCGMIVKVAI